MAEYKLVEQKNVSCLYKGKNVYCLSLYTFVIQFFSLLFGRQVHKDNKLEIMTNLGKSRLVKVIFTNIHKMSDACANSFGRYILIAQCMKNGFTFYYIQF